MEPKKRIRKITITIEETTTEYSIEGGRSIQIEGGFSNCELVGIFEVYKTQFGIAAIHESIAESEVKPDEPAE